MFQRLNVTLVKQNMLPKELSTKIIAGIFKSPGVTYSRLEEHANKLGIPLNIFLSAMQLVHKSKAVQSKLLKGVLVYVVREEPKAATDILADWRKANPYPYPVLCQECQGKLCAGCYPFYDPVKDTLERIRGFLIMTREEYKAKSQGKTFIPKKKSYEYTKK